MMSHITVCYSPTEHTLGADTNILVNPNEALELINKYRHHEGFYGVMLWDAGSSDSNVIDGCTYSQQISSILLKGKVC